MKQQKNKPTLDNLKFCIIVQCLGYWGRGQTILDAANACHKAGAGRSAPCVVEMFYGDDKVTVNDNLTISVDPKAQRLQLITNIKLGSLLRATGEGSSVKG